MRLKNLTGPGLCARLFAAGFAENMGQALFRLNP
jgi:hypothetical protein